MTRTAFSDRRRRTMYGAGVLLAVVLAALLAGYASAAEGIRTIPASEASGHVGEMAKVCGHVASAAFFASAKGRPTFINLDRPYPDQTFTVVIWESARARFDVPPERLVDGKTICVRGKIETYGGKPQIVVDDPEQIEITEVDRGGEALSPTERVFVKSLLSALGYDANYGTPEWDQEAVEAAIAFQEDAGLSTSGEPDTATLRALAGKVGELPEADLDMVIRLLLFELVRRQE
jgi:hypothetical protein